MAKRDLENKAGNRMFENSDVLELLSKSSPTIILITYIPIIVGLFGYGLYMGYQPSILASIGLFIGAFAFWTLAEYLLHRWVFHVLQGKKGLDRLYQLAHGMHHDHPKDPNRLFMPPLVGIGLILFFFGLFWLVMQQLTFFFLPGFIVGYISYVMTHYAMHRINPPFKFLEPLWKHHHLHHYRHPELAFGVSNFFWDVVFRTMPPKPKKRDKTTEPKQQAAA